MLAKITAQRPPRPRTAATDPVEARRVDGFLLLLYAILVLGMAGIGLLAWALLGL
jgi:hypothetical protein